MIILVKYTVTVGVEVEAESQAEAQQSIDDLFQEISDKERSDHGILDYKVFDEESFLTQIDEENEARKDYVNNGGNVWDF